MAVTKIKYENKESLQNDVSIPDKNKVTDADMNEIKQVVNNNADETMAMQENIKDLQEGQGTSDTEITNLKNKVSTLENDNDTNKTNISNLQKDNTTNKNNISDLQKDDTTNKKDISDIKTEQKTQNTNIKNAQDQATNAFNLINTEIIPEISNLQQGQESLSKNIQDNTNKNTEQDELISKLKNAAINAKTEEAKSLHVVDANRFGSLEVLGNAEQETREGYSLWDYLSAVLNSAGTMQIEKDLKEGYITVNGTPNNNYVNLCAQKNITDMLEDGATYTLWQERYADSNTKGIYLQVRETTSDGTTNYFSRDNAATFTVNKQNATYQIGLQTASIADTGALTNYKNRYMLYKGTDTKTYELPGATPSIEYPSKVICLGNNKQLFDKDNANKISATPSGSKIIASSSGAKSFYLEVKSNTDYTISRKIVGQRFLAATSVEVPAIGTSLTQNVTNNTGDEINIRTRANDKYLLVYYLYNSSENEEEILSSIKVEEGDTATSYSPYRTR